MMKLKTKKLCFLLAVALVFNCRPSNQAGCPEMEFPNIIYILADDMGYGDVSAFNEQSKIRTPNIDALAAQGMVFTDAHSGSAVCTPTRYGVLTGRYAWRTWVKKGVLWSYDEPLISPTRTTVASLLKKHDYHTAAIGKWHLGLGWQKGEDGTVDLIKPIKNGPNANGFDYFFGITASLDIPPYIYIENDRSTTTVIDTISKNDGKGFWRRGPVGDDFKHEEVLPKLMQKAVQYIDAQAKNDAPFFLYFPLPAPHTPILPTEEFLGKSGTNEYGDFVLMVDDVVEQVVAALEKNNISENTMVVFTSDNGCSPMADFDELAKFGHQPGYIYRGHKADIFEGGHRVPFVVRWPERIKAGTRYDETVCLTDLMATCAAIVGDSLAADEGEDSFDLTSALLGKVVSGPIREATVHHSIEGVFSIRQNKWKLIFGPGSGGWSEPKPQKAKTLGLPSLQLYDLEQDPGELNNLADQEPELVKKLTALMKKYIAQGRSTPGAPQPNDTETTLYLNGSQAE